MSVVSASKNKVSYFREVQQELRRVSWTSKAELLSHTKVVLASIFMCGLGVYTCDLAIRGVIGVLGNVFRWVFG